MDANPRCEADAPPVGSGRWAAGLLWPNRIQEQDTYQNTNQFQGWMESRDSNQGWEVGDSNMMEFELEYLIGQDSDSDESHPQRLLFAVCGCHSTALWGLRVSQPSVIFSPFVSILAGLNPTLIPLNARCRQSQGWMSLPRVSPLGCLHRVGCTLDSVANLFEGEHASTPWRVKL